MRDVLYSIMLSGTFSLLFTSYISGQELDEDVSYYINIYNDHKLSANFIEAAHLAFRLGNHYDQELKNDIAKKYFQESASYARESGITVLEAEALYRLANVLSRMADLPGESKRNNLLREVVKYARESRLLFTKIKAEDVLPLIEVSLLEGEANISLDRPSQAIAPLKLALSTAQKYEMRVQALEAAESLFEVYTSMGADNEALQYAGMAKEYDVYLNTKDSLEELTYQKIELEQANQQKEGIIRDKDTQIKDKEAQILIKDRDMRIKEQERQLALQDLEAEAREKRFLMHVLMTVGVFSLALLIAIILVIRSRRLLKLKNEKIMEQQKQIIEEKQRSEKLLHNILPIPVATELKQNGKARPMLYDMVSVLFTDFKGFTTIASSMSPDEIIEELEICFSAFDNIIEKHNLEKIKTMGDGYMAAGGIPIRNTTNAVDAVLAGMEMQRFMRWKQEEKRKKGQKYFELRVGIHTGPVIAGVIGKKKFAYDIWGDAVNLASRMESSGVEGKVNISYATYQQIQDHFFVTYRGRVDAKNKGFLDMYFVEGLREKNGKPLIR